MDRRWSAEVDHLQSVIAQPGTRLVGPTSAKGKRCWIENKLSRGVGPRRLVDIERATEISGDEDRIEAIGDWPSKRLPTWPIEAGERHGRRCAPDTSAPNTNEHVRVSAAQFPAEDENGFVPRDPRHRFGHRGVDASTGIALVTVNNALSKSPT